MADLGRLRERVLDLEHERSRWRRLRLSRELLQPRIDRDRTLLAERERAYAAEQADVDRLHGIGVARLRAMLDGTLDERRVEELAQAQEAAARVEEIQARLATLALEADRLDGEIALLGDPETAYQEALSDLVLAARARGHLGGRSTRGTAEEVVDPEEVLGWAERRQRQISQRAEVDVVLPVARQLVAELKRVHRRIPVVAAGIEASVSMADPHGGVYWFDGLRAVRRQVAAADEVVGHLRDDLAASDLPEIAVPDLADFPAGDGRFFDPLSAEDLTARVDEAVAWAADRLAAAQALVEELVDLRTRLADA
ncbi:hypothetical protein BJF86_03295 [Serinicoccus sp. CNJ-927]|uniref:hypothetical protein n=1 Tax=Serinicoccus sp. CNJ-927 TaxID=1904970 RepID=UPI00095C4225|nr:hypothetical protein [Serinicoccus sp. CNJ-927]OLT42022.1 hypothetical protein BJF86_03295 [Serinicoccus sp. CNJ-927]